MSEEEELRFKRGKGWISSSTFHGGKLPHDIAAWMTSKSGKWAVDKTLEVNQGRKWLFVTSPSHLQVQGVYMLEPGTCSDRPMWSRKDQSEKSKSETRTVMCADRNTKWILTSMAELKANQCRAAICYPKDQEGTLPYELPGRWQRSDGEWKDDERFAVRAVPGIYYIKSASKSEHTGAYQLSVSSRNGMPMWRHESTTRPYALFSNAYGKWVIGKRDPKASDEADKGWIRHPEVHCGSLPHEMVQGRWERAAASGWQADALLGVVTFECTL